MRSIESIQEQKASEFSMSSENLLDVDIRAPICKQEEDFDSSFSDSQFMSTFVKKQK